MLQPARPPVRLPSQLPKRHRFNNQLRNNDQSPSSLSALEEEYTEHIQAEVASPSDIDDINDHSSVLRYQSHMDSVIEGLKCVYRYCGLFVSKKESQIYAIDDCLIRNSIRSGLLILSYIDCCAISDNDICLYLTCSRLLLLENRPKFGIFNSLPHMDCQLYPLALADLSMAEEAAIACAYPVVSILKLRPFGVFNPAAYSYIKGHIVLLPQNPASLLTLFPSQTLALYDVIRLVRAGQGCPTDLDLQYFILVRKQTLLNALT